MNDLAIKKSSFSLKMQLEIISLLITALLTYLIIYPLLNSFSQFQFLISNIFFIVIFFTYSRYLFLFKHTFLADFQWAKFAVIFISLPLGWYLVENLQNFQIFLDDEGLGNFEKHFKTGIDYEQKQTVINYMRREMIFFGSSAIIAAFILPFRLLISFWRVYNNTGNV
jgi:hypothetical protein